MLLFCSYLYYEPTPNPSLGRGNEPTPNPSLGRGTEMVVGGGMYMLFLVGLSEVLEVEIHQPRVVVLVVFGEEAETAFELIEPGCCRNSINSEESTS